MQPRVSSPAGSSSNSPHQRDLISGRRTPQASRSHPVLAPSPSRVVLAEGSEFILESVPARSSPTTSRVAVSTRHVSSPHRLSPSSSSSQASSPFSNLASPPATRIHNVSPSITPPRSRHVDRPYRPPPSSSARFYERQQQLWLLQQPSLLSTTSSQYPDSHHRSQVSPKRPSFHQSQPSTDLPLSPRGSSASPRFGYIANRDHVSSASQDRIDLGASSTSRLRAASASSLTVPDALTGNRARSGSDVSFTRSRISTGYQSQTDEESFDNDPLPASGVPTSNLESNGFQAKLAQSAQRPAARVVQSNTDSEPLRQSWGTPSRHPLSSVEALGDSNDDDWDKELGISAADHAEPLRLPQLPTGEQSLHSSPTTIGHLAAAKPPTASSKLIVSTVTAPVQTSAQLSSIQASDLKGIRVTSAVSESWDDDFLFQNEVDPAGSERNHDTARPPNASGRGGAVSGSGSMQFDEDDDDVENWDDAFSWNVDQITPSASTTSSLNDAMQRAKANAPSRRVSAQVRQSTEMQKRFSNSSAGSGTTDFSARLAAQSDVGSSSRRTSQDTTDLSAFDLVRGSDQRNALVLAEKPRRRRNTIESDHDASGDDTETETPVKEAPAATKPRPARRSLGAALGFDSRRKPAKTVENKKVGESEADGPLSETHRRPKLGALQRLSFSRSRVNVTNTSTTDVSELPEANESSQRFYNDIANRSQASLLSQMSGSSNQSRRGSLEKSYAALRSTSFRRLLSRGGQSGSSTNMATHPTPPSSPPRRRSELPQHTIRLGSPTSELSPANSPSLSTSPPSAWLGFRRSIETTPKRKTSRSRPKGGGSAQNESPGEVAWAVPTSPSRAPILTADMSQMSDVSSSFGDVNSEEARMHGNRSRIRDANSPLKGLRSMENPPAAGLHRDFSSSNTLRASLGYGGGFGAPSVTENNHTLARDEPYAGNRLLSSRASHNQGYSDEATADGPTAAGYHYMGEKMLRGSNERASNSRSVSASTAHSQNSSESAYGYRMRKQISVSSGADAQGSETSYGTSVGSSPGHSNQSAGWSSFSKRGGAAFADTSDTPWSSSLHVSGYPDPSKTLDDNHNRDIGAPVSRVNVERTSDGSSSRMQSDPQANFSPPRPPLSDQNSLSVGKTTPSPSHADVHPTKQSPIDRSGSNDLSVGDSSLVGPASSTASSQPRVTRRNSLSDLRIPTRISKAQHGIRNNITLVRDFAKGIEELKLLKASYMDHKTNTAMSNTDVEERIQNWLECADVLIGLGEGRSESDSAARVDTVSHTPMAVRTDPRRTTFSDASSYASPRSPLEAASLRQVPNLGARSTSGTSQTSTSTTASHATSGVRSVDAQREIDILSAILGGTKISPATSRTEGRSHSRFLSETYSRDDYPQRRAQFVEAIQTPLTEKRGARSAAATPNLQRVDDTRSTAAERNKESSRPYNTAPVLSSSSSGGVVPIDAVDAVDPNRSAKRRLRSASRAGLQGLRDLLKVFKSNAAAGDVTVTPPHSAAAVDSSLTQHTPSDERRFSVDGEAATPSSSSPAKQKRRSLNLKRRSFLRSRTSLESMKGATGTEAPVDDAPPVPIRTPDEKRSKASASRTSLDITWEAGSPRRDAKATSKSARRISLQSSASNKRRSSEVARLESLPQSVDSRSLKAARPSLPTRSEISSSAECRRASASNETSAGQQPAMMPKLALRPEAMPGLLVYVQATKEHLQAAIHELGPPASLAR